MRDGEIRNIRIGSNMPSFKNIQVNSETNVVWKITLGKKIVWQLKQQAQIDICEYLDSNFTNDLIRFYNVNYKQYISFTDILWYHKNKSDAEYIKVPITYYQENIINVETTLPIYKTPNGYFIGLEIMGNCPTENYPVKIKFKSPLTNEILEYQFNVSCYNTVIANLIIDVARTQDNKMIAYFTKKCLTSTEKVGDNISIFWNDGTGTSYLTYNNTTAIHTYADNIKSARIVLSGSLEYLQQGFIGNQIYVTNMIISNKITKIHDYALANFEIISINLPDTLLSIGSYSFTNCSKLTSITIPDSVISIGERAFERCSSLQFISVPATIQGNSFVYNTTKEIYYRGTISNWIGNGKHWYFDGGQDGEHKILCYDGYITHVGDFLDPNDHTTIISGLQYHYYEN